MRIIFQTLAVLINLYMILCFIRIMLTWIPGLSYRPFARMLSNICDPFMNLFRGIRWLHFANFDFSPILSLGLLVGLSTICENIARYGHFSIGSLLAVIISVIWSLISGIIGFLLLFLVIRLIVLLISKNNYNPGWNQFDYAISPLVMRISGSFSNGKPVSYKTALIVSIIILILIEIVGKFLFGYISYMCSIIPF